MVDALARDVQPDLRPLLAVSEQIDHLKKRGVVFELCSEEQAAEYLRTGNNLLRTSSYRKLYPTKAKGTHAGEYAGLDFEHLRFLSSLDRRFRECLLPITLDIEHFAKIQILNACEARGEDGYEIVRDYLAHLNHQGRNHIEGAFRARGSEGITHDDYSGDLIAKHLAAAEHLYGMPVWVFLEAVEFRAFNDFYLFCAQRWGNDQMLQQHYVLKSVRALRNACAHNSCILNGIGGASRKSDARTNELVTDSLNAHGMKRSKSRRAKLSNLRVSQLAATLYADSLYCSREQTLRRHSQMFEELRSAWVGSSDLFEKNPAITSFFDFFFRLVDIWVPHKAE